MQKPLRSYWPWMLVPFLMWVAAAALYLLATRNDAAAPFEYTLH